MPNWLDRGRENREAWGERVRNQQEGGFRDYLRQLRMPQEEKDAFTAWGETNPTMEADPPVGQMRLLEDEKNKDLFTSHRPETDEITRQANIIRDEHKENLQSAIDAAIQTVEREQWGLNKSLDTRISEIQQNLPNNPYGPQLVEQNIQIMKDDIMTSLREDLQVESQTKAARGFVGGGQLSAAAAVERGAATSGIASESGRIRTSAMNFNQQAAQFKEMLLTDIEKYKGDLNTKIGMVMSAYEASNVTDPSLYWDMATDIEAIRTGHTQLDAMMELSREAVESLDPGFMDYVSDAFRIFGTASGSPLLGGLGSLAVDAGQDWWESR